VSDGAPIKIRECNLYECYNHCKEGSRYCIFHQPIRPKKEEKMKVELVIKQTFSWVKHLKIEVEGVTYNARLYWDTHEGFDLSFYDSEGKPIVWPKWAEDYDNAMRDLHSDLDSMSEKEEVA
jgi:hypothetical protein